MRKILSAFILIILTILQSVSAQNLDKNSITGSWLGKIRAGAIELRVIFNLSVVANDSLVATLDSPDQGAKGIKLGPVTFTGETIKISAGALLAEYNGKIINDTLIEGIWKQAGNSLDLNLTKLKAEFVQNRPQEPKPPYPYISEDVVFKNTIDSFVLAGTLTIPEGEGPFPAVILISGSGPQNRNEELMGHKPFLVIADYLTRNGIAVLRYDDRGVGKSKGDRIDATTANFATDVLAAFNFLVSKSKINPDSIGLIGHSEGGLVAPIAATSDNKIAFIVSLAGTGVNGEQIINRQLADINRASGMDEKKIRESVTINKKLWAILKKEPDNNLASEKMTEKYRQILLKKKTSAEDMEIAVKQVQASLNPASLTWMRYFIITDPIEFWKKVKCPVLALNGEMDLQVNADINLKEIAKALKSGGNNAVKTIKLPGLNHLFQHCKTGLPSEYAEIEETFSPEVLKVIADWITEL